MKTETDNLFAMKENLLKFKESGLFMVIVMLLCSVFGVCDGAAMTADVINPVGGGAVNTSAMTTAGETRDNAENLILDTIDEKVTKIRPYDVVLDTIARNIKDVKHSDSQIIRHYAIDTIDLSTKLKVAYAGGDKQAAIEAEDNDIFASEQTIFVDGVSGYKEDGTTVDPLRKLMLYVVGKDTTGKPLVTAVNGKGMDRDVIPAIPAGAKLTRGGRAGSETQIQTDAYLGVPTDFPQYLQKFMAQVEESTMMKIADKEVDWDFSDQEEEAIFDMKRVQNVSFWLGVRNRIKKKNAHTQKAEDIYFTEGLWTQAGKEFSFGAAPVTAENIVSLMKHAFTGNASGKKKLFICGSDMIEAFEQVEYTKVVYVGSKLQAHGVEFTSIVSKFGTLLLAHDQSLDDMGWAGNGFILDADFLRKWTMGWRVNNFDLRGSGQSDADGRGLMEICGLVLKNPKAHSRVTLA